MNKVFLMDFKLRRPAIVTARIPSKIKAGNPHYYTVEELRDQPVTPATSSISSIIDGVITLNAAVNGGSKLAIHRHLISKHICANQRF